MAVGARDEVLSRQAFIAASEVWVPDASGERLIRANGVYGSPAGPGGAAPGQSLARGEGLPGRAWSEARPILIGDLRGSGLLEGEAGDGGRAAAVAVPVFARSALRGVLVMLCGSNARGIGAIEIWRGDDASAQPMRLEAGFYGAADAFRAASERTVFERGQGLPGGVWASGAPMLMRDLGSASGFLRSASARAAGLSTGLGLPVPTPSGPSYALTLLSARATPIARRFELWETVPGKAGQPGAAMLVDGLCETEGPLWQTERRLPAWQGAVGRALATGVPVVEASPAVAAGAPRFDGIVAFPIHAHGEVTRVVAWFY